MTLPTFTFPIYLPNHFNYTDFYSYIYQITLPSPTDFTVTYFSPYIYQINLKILTFPRIFAKFFKQLVSLWYNGKLSEQEPILNTISLPVIFFQNQAIIFPIVFWRVTMNFNVKFQVSRQKWLSCGSWYKKDHYHCVMSCSPIQFGQWCWPIDIKLYLVYI